VLFPALLCQLDRRGEVFAGPPNGGLLVVAVSALLAAALLGFLARPVLRPPAALFASCVQTTFRYNSYLGLALAQSLAGSRGVALLALIFSVCIPLANLIAVSTMARHSQAGLVRELAPQPADHRHGERPGGERHRPAVAAVRRARARSPGAGEPGAGADLRRRGADPGRRSHAPRAARLLLRREAAAVSCRGAGARLAARTTGEQAQIALVFAALPTATTAYVLATRMGFDGAPVSFLITAQTLASMATLPLWSGLLQGSSEACRRSAHATCSRTSEDGESARARSASTTVAEVGALPSPTARLRSQRS